MYQKQRCYIRRGKTWARLSSLLLLFLVTGCTSGATPGNAAQPMTIPTAQAMPPSTQGNVTYHGGPAQLSPSSYLIFWGQSWLHDTALQATKQRIESYFQHVGGTDYESVLTQYYMQNPDGSQSHIANVAHFSDSQVWVDPANPVADSQACHGATISDQAIKQEIAHTLATTHWNRDDKNVTYFVYTPPSFDVFEPTWGCSGQTLCGDHEWSPDMAGMHVAYTILPYPAERCTQPDVSAELVNASAHEQFESITDPTPGRADDTTFKNEGWFYVDAHKQASEIGDLCFRQRGPRDLQGVTFVLQSIWSNQVGGCV